MTDLPIKESQVGILENYLKSRGFVYEPILEDMLDHLYMDIKSKMQDGLSFMDAFEKVKTEFGSGGIDRVYFETIHNLNSFTMFKSYLISAWRNLRRQKIYTSINILGLVLGLSVFTTIGIYVEDELSYDKFHPSYENTYRVSARIISNGQEYNEATCQFPLAEALRSDFSGVASTVRIHKPYSIPLLRRNEVKFTEDQYYYVDDSFFEIFGHQLLQGDPALALKDPNSIILTEAAAARYFGQEDPLGQLIEFVEEDKTRSLKVTGIVEQHPHTHFKFDILVPLQFQLNRWKEWGDDDGPETKWFWTGTWTYAQFENHASQEIIQKELPSVVQKYFPTKWKEESSLEMDRIDRIHLHSHRLSEMSPNGSVTQITVFSTIALIILLIAVINFINLMSAQGLNYAKQVGVRKFLGALRLDIVLQFLMESILVVVCAGIIAAALTHFILIPQVNHITDKELSLIPYLIPRYVILYGVGLFVFGALAGVYPALVFARFDSLKILKGSLRSGKAGALLRQSFVVVQFMASVVLIIAVLVISYQREYIGSMDIGFDRENILVIPASGTINDRLEAFKNEVKKLPGVIGISATLDVPGRGTSSIRFIPEGHSFDQPEQLPITYVDHDFMETANLELAYGRFFDRSHPSDPERAFIINEKAARLLGWESDAVGKKMQMFAPGSPEIGKRGEIVGVIRDYNFESIHNPIRPLVMILHTTYDYYLVKYKGVELNELSTGLTNIWSQFDPQWPMEPYLMDQSLKDLYASEEKLSRVTNYGMFFALLIAFIGIFGLSSFIMNRRTKEVGIRRVLGSSTYNILAILSRNFIVMVTLANVLAWPIAYYLLQSWLANFEYNVGLSWTVFFMASIVSFMIACLAIGYHTLKISKTDPVHSLRYE